MSGDIFGPANLAKAVHDSLDAAQATIPEGHNQALLLRATYNRQDGPGVEAVYVKRVGAGWSVLLETAYHGEDGPSAGAAVAWSGK